jgi:tetratricopeptide (TPR) repeat protein
MVVLAAAPIAAADVEEQIQKYFELAKAGKDEAAAKKLGEAVITGAAKDANVLNEFAWKILTDDGIAKRDLEVAMRAAKAAYDACEGKEAAIVDTYARAFFDTGKAADAIKFQKKAVELCQDDNLRPELAETLQRYEKKEEQIQKYFELAKAGKDEAAKKLGKEILAGAAKEANVLNDFAWKILTEEGIAKRDLDLAMRAAKDAYDACEGKEAAIVDTYARALFDTGKVADAIKFQKKAVELCQDDNLRPELAETLKRYEKKKSETK